jgi:hypothetical protein
MALGCMEHRGACSADDDSGDGAGIMTQVPWALLKTEFPDIDEAITGCAPQPKLILSCRCMYTTMNLACYVPQSFLRHETPFLELKTGENVRVSTARHCLLFHLVPLPGGRVLHVKLKEWWLCCRVGMVFLPNDDALATTSRQIVEDVVATEGRCRVVGWREVPVDKEVVGRLARVTEPRIWQVMSDNLGR